jgi:AcrR family transcriptional regulator
MPSYTAKSQTAPLQEDGRRARSAKSRQQIIQAMMALVGEGVLFPSAEAVAKRASVGLRSVFRHFNDMDSLYLEMSRAIESSLTAVVSTPLADTAWRGQLDEIMERRARAFEALGPYLRAAQANRHRSQTLDRDYRRVSLLSRENLRGVLLLAGKMFALEPLDLILSFETWTRLRTDQALDVEATRKAISAMTDAVLAHPGTT